MEHPNLLLIQAFYAARACQDFVAIRALLHEAVIWHEPRLEGSQFTGDLAGPTAVLGMMRKALEITDGTFSLTPDGILAHNSHTVALIRWSATRDGQLITGSEFAVYRLKEGKILEVWFYPEKLGSDEQFWAGE